MSLPPPPAPDSPHSAVGLRVLNGLAVGLERREIRTVLGLTEHDLAVAMRDAGIRLRCEATRVPLVVAAVRAGLLHAAEIPTVDPDRVTAQEREVLLLVVRGLTDRQITARYGVEPRTVARWLAAAYRALGARNRGAAVAIAIHNKIVD